MDGFSTVIRLGVKAPTMAERRKLMQFALLVYETPEAFAARNNEKTGGYVGAWRGDYTPLGGGGGVRRRGPPLGFQEKTTRKNTGAREPPPGGAPSASQ